LTGIGALRADCGTAESPPKSLSRSAFRPRRRLTASRLERLRRRA